MAQKVIVLSGASGGIGKSLLQQFLLEGYSIIALYYNHQNFVKDERVIPYQIDLTHSSEIERLAKYLEDNQCTIHALVHAAGISKSATLEKTTFENWKETFAINIDAPFYLTKVLTPFFSEIGGSVVFLSSVVAQTGVYGTSSYAASKAALFGLTKTLSKEFASKSININTLALGYFDAGMISDVPEKHKTLIIDQIPMKKLGDPKSIGATILHLISENGRYITGQIINVNGGLYA